MWEQGRKQPLKMPAYHSVIPAKGKFIGNVPILPLRVTAKGTGRGPAPPTVTPNEEDIVDESLNIFKANILFTSFEVQTMPQTDGDDSAS